MEFLGACPKCNGSMKAWDDAFGVYVMCRSCGELRELEGKEARWLRKKLRRASRQQGQLV